MKHSAQDQVVLEQLIHWAAGQPLVRAMLLTSSRAVPQAPTDLFSDYDVILALRDIQPFYTDRTWLEAFGPLLVLYRDPLIYERGLVRSAFVTQYENGLKIDFSLWPVELLQKVVADPQLPEELDAGYQVLLDKDHLTAELKPPTYTAYIPLPPTETEYLETLETFFLEAIYAAKYLWRDDMLAAKHILDALMKQEHLRPMLEWRMELERGWSVKPGPYGRRLKQWLRLDLWSELERTYTGAELEDNWAALAQTIGLMGRVAREVGERMGYDYPQELEQRVVAFLQKVRQLERDAESFG